MPQLCQIGFLINGSRDTIGDAAGFVPAGAVFYADFLSDQYNWGGADKALSDLSFSRASAGTYVDADDGLIKTALTDVERFNVGGILLERAATNLIQRSEELNQAIWTKAETTVTANAATAPDGNTAADRLNGTATVAAHDCRSSSVSFVSGTRYVASVYAKASGSSFLQMAWLSASHGLNAFANFNLTTGATYNVGSSATARITDVGGGWYRCEISAQATASSSQAGIVLLNATATGLRFESFNASASSVLLWGAQVETGLYATSYIATAGSSATRAADVLTLDLASAGITLGTEYSSHAEYTPYGADSGSTHIVFELNDGTADNRANQAYTSTATNQTVTDAAAAQTAPSSIAAIALNAVNKVACRFKLNDFGICRNASAVTADTSGTLPAALTTLDIGNAVAGSQILGSVSKLVLYDNAKNDAALQALTT